MLEDSPGEIPLAGGVTNAGTVVRVGDTVRRLRGRGSPTVEALLLHLESVGFDGSPRFLGIDERGRQIVTYLEGVVDSSPSWQQDDALNARQLGRVASLLRRLHTASSSFEPPSDGHSRRALPLFGTVWTHGDPIYANVVFRAGVPVSLIDWEFAAPADRLCDLAGLLATEVRGPRMDADDHGRRVQAVRLALSAIAVGYGLSPAERADLPLAAAAVLIDAAAFWTTVGLPPEQSDRAVWKADWFTKNADRLTPRRQR